MPTIKLIAHRGYQAQYPENTLLSMAEAIRAGALYLETDIQLSADGQPILFHDDSLTRLCGKDAAVNDLLLADLLALEVIDDRSQARPPPHPTITPLTHFTTLLSAHPYVHAFIEVKRAAIDAHGVNRVYDEITRVLAPTTAQCTLISFAVEFIEHARKSGSPSVGVVLEHWRQHQDNRITALSPAYLFCNYKTLTAGEINLDHTHLRETKLAVYEVADPKLALQLLARGVDLIETFNFGAMHQVLNETQPPVTDQA